MPIPTILSTRLRTLDYIFKFIFVNVSFVFCQLPHFLPSKFELKMNGDEQDLETDFVAGDLRVETQVDSQICW